MAIARQFLFLWLILHLGFCEESTNTEYKLEDESDDSSIKHLKDDAPQVKEKTDEVKTSIENDNKNEVEDSEKKSSMEQKGEKEKEEVVTENEKEDEKKEKQLDKKEEELQKSKEALDEEKKKIMEKNMKDLKPYLMVVSMIAKQEDIEALAKGEGSEEYISWVNSLEKRLADAYALSNLEAKVQDADLPVVTVEQVQLTEEAGSSRLRVAFFVSLTGKGPIPKERVKEVYGSLTPEDKGTSGGSRTFSIIAFVLGWVCLAALIVILAYLGIKYRDGIKSLAKRIEYWSNPNRNGYSNLGGDTMAADWRSDASHLDEDTRSYGAGGTGVTSPDPAKPKKKLRAPGGLLSDDQADLEAGAKKSYGTAGVKPLLPDTDVYKENTQLRLSELAADGDRTPPMTPKSMQKHLIKKYQDKQAEESSKHADEPLTASNSEIFPEDFEDCVEEEEIFNMKP